MGSSDSGELHRLLEDGVVDEIIGRLKTGKEAEVWLVSHAGEIVAAKVYKDSTHRSFQNRSGYQEGRQVRNSRTRRAMEKGSKFGRAAEEDAWKSTEADALYKLHALGVRVPKPVMFYEGVLLMEAVIDPEGHPAPRLMDASIAPENALALYKDLRGHVIRMLCADVIHGDLSPYNVLLAWNGPTLIDFPQVVGAAGNSRSEMYFKRDLENLRSFFGGLDRAVLQLSGDGHEIWRAYTRRELTPDFEPTGKAPAEPPRPAGAPAAPGAGGFQRREYRPGDERARGNGYGRGRPNGGNRPQGNPSAQGGATPAGPGEERPRQPNGGTGHGGGHRGQGGEGPRKQHGSPARGGGHREQGADGPRHQHGGPAHGGGHRGQGGEGPRHPNGGPAQGGGAPRQQRGQSGQGGGHRGQGGGGSRQQHGGGHRGGQGRPRGQGGPRGPGGQGGAPPA